VDLAATRLGHPIVGLSSTLPSPICLSGLPRALRWCRKPGPAGGHHRGWAMEIQRSTRDGCLVLAFTGSINLFTVSQVQRALLKGLSEQPEALICDLTRVQALDLVCARVFSTVATTPPAAGRRPVCCCVPPSRGWPRS
jgi:anti-anti-sigma regulatory factor